MVKENEAGNEEIVWKNQLYKEEIKICKLFFNKEH